MKWAQAEKREATMQARVAELSEALVWHEEQARLARLIHSEGDAGRNALASDGGSKAREALSRTDRQSLAEVRARALEDYAHVNGDAGNIGIETVSDMLAKAARIRAED